MFENLPSNIRSHIGSWIYNPVCRSRTLIISPRLLKRGTNACYAYKQVGIPNCFLQKKSFVKRNVYNDDTAIVSYEPYIGWMIYLRDRSNKHIDLSFISKKKFYNNIAFK